MSRVTPPMTSVTNTIEQQAMSHHATARWGRWDLGAGIGQPVSGFSAGFFQQADVFDHHAAVDSLAHIVNGEQADAGGGQRFHLHAGAADSFGRDVDGDAALWSIEREVHCNTCERNRVAQRNQLGCAFAALNRGDAGYTQHVTLFRRAALDQGESGRIHANAAAHAGDAGGLNLGADVDHMGLTGGVEVGQWICCLAHEISCHNLFLESRYHSEMKPHPLVRPLILSLLLTFAVPPPAMAEGLPDLGEAAQIDLSPAMERHIGEAAMNEIRRDPAWLGDPEINAYLNRLGNRLAAQSEESHQSFELFALHDMTLNAFAMPGGFIGVHTGLILAAESESELASVLAHEISHVTQHHLARLVNKSGQGQVASLVALAVAVLAARSNPDAAVGVALAGQAAGIQNQLNYSRDFEREADRIGLGLLERAGYDIRGMENFFGRLQKFGRLYENNAPVYLRTHPLTTERLADIGNRIQGRPWKQIPDSFEFQLVRAKLRAAESSAQDAVIEFQGRLRERKFSGSEAAVRYGLARALARAGNLAAAEQQVGALRSLKAHSPMIETLAAELRLKQNDAVGAVKILRTAYASYMQERAVVYGLVDALLVAGQPADALKVASDDLLSYPSDATLYALQAQTYAALGQRLQQHRAQAEAYALDGRLGEAVEQLDLAQKAGDGSFYEQSQVDARLREFRKRLEEEKKLSQAK